MDLRNTNLSMYVRYVLCITLYHTNTICTYPLPTTGTARMINNTRLQIPLSTFPEPQKISNTKTITQNGDRSPLRVRFHPDTSSHTTTSLLGFHHKKPFIPSLQKTMNDHKSKIESLTRAKNIIREYNNSLTNTNSWLLESITKICTITEAPMTSHGFIFECTRNAAKSNHKLLAKFDYDLAALIKAHPGSIVSPGTEFRPVQRLHPLLHRHHDWHTFQAILLEGADYPLRPDALPENDLHREVDIMIASGNHKSACTETHSRVLREAYEKEVSHGWQIPITVESLKKMKNVLIIPLGVACQLAVNEEGNYVDKFRVTHDCSFNYSFGLSLNSAVDMV